MSQREIELSIDELIMEGFEIRDHYRFGQALQNELQRLFAERGIPASLSTSARIANLDGGTVPTTQNAGSENLGIQVANTLYRGISK